jgi:hypothetical protein
MIGLLRKEEIMKKIHYELVDDVAQITMDDGKANAMDWGFFEDIGETLDRSEKEGAKVLIITGRPDFFSGGLDLNLVPTLSPREYIFPPCPHHCGLPWPCGRWWCHSRLFMRPSSYC